MKLIIFGDELLCGKDSLGELVAERLGLEFENHAAKDTSNTKIHNSIIDFLVSKNTDNLIFLIGWTSPYRLDAEYNDEYFTYRPDRNNYPNLKMNKLHKFDNYIFDRIVMNQRWVSIVYGVQQILELQKIKYFMFNTQTSLEYSTYTEKTIKNLNQKLYFDCINNKSTMKNYLENLGYQTIDKIAINEYAKFVSQKFRQQGLVNKI